MNQNNDKQMLGKLETIDEWKKNELSFNALLDVFVQIIEIVLSEEHPENICSLDCFGIGHIKDENKKVMYVEVVRRDSEKEELKKIFDECVSEQQKGEMRENELPLLIGIIAAKLFMRTDAPLERFVETSREREWKSFICEKNVEANVTCNDQEKKWLIELITKATFKTPGERWNIEELVEYIKTWEYSFKVFYVNGQTGENISENVCCNKDLYDAKYVQNSLKVTIPKGTLLCEGQYILLEDITIRFASLKKDIQMLVLPTDRWILFCEETAERTIDSDYYAIMFSEKSICVGGVSSKQGCERVIPDIFKNDVCSIGAGEKGQSILKNLMPDGSFRVPKGIEFYNIGMTEFFEDVFAEVGKKREEIASKIIITVPASLYKWANVMSEACRKAYANVDLRIIPTAVALLMYCMQRSANMSKIKFDTSMVVERFEYGVNMSMVKREDVGFFLVSERFFDYDDNNLAIRIAEWLDKIDIEVQTINSVIFSGEEVENSKKQVISKTIEDIFKSASFICFDKSMQPDRCGALSFLLFEDKKIGSSLSYDGSLIGVMVKDVFGRPYFEQLLQLSHEKDGNGKWDFTLSLRSEDCDEKLYLYKLDGRYKNISTTIGVNGDKFMRLGYFKPEFDSAPDKELEQLIEYHFQIDMETIVGVGEKTYIKTPLRRCKLNFVKEESAVRLFSGW